MRELFFIVLVFARADGTGVDMTVMSDQRFTDAQTCIDATGPALDKAKKSYSLARGALCYTALEISQFAPGSYRVCKGETCSELIYE